MCAKHAELTIKYICTREGCLHELCEMCLLEHKEHIASIKSVFDIIEKSCSELEAKDLKSVKTAIMERERDSFDKIDKLLDEFYCMLKQKCQALKRKMLNDYSSKTNFLENYERFKELTTQVRGKKDLVSTELIGVVKEYLQYENNPKITSISVDPHFYPRFDQIFNECVQEKESFDTGEEGHPKVGRGHGS